ncbi:YiiD C-terminal domain-containing protein [Luteimonas sp. RD2P54]|uniref:YiiD C-terminal domain-containing protein n=1 Tax=Luteimonas endophytica TaxID=3042023 RepID=A0ABT6J922_9GAMM|nr:YiiD C-terminal domain-containing protein [Luteimonas endophytica]MDH5823308.1 YiiD C-terminal domain-containing protein [Luteimonas endophytica]
MSPEESLRALDAHYQAMPPVAAMRLRIAGYDGECLRLHAPLAQHVNDKGCAFGGSLVSLMTLSSWGLVSLRIREAGLQADVFVADSSVRYLAPLYADLESESRLAPDLRWSDFTATLRERGRARTTLSARVPLPDGGTATEGLARYVAIARR